MATEGTFPKIDGDILHASEATRLAPRVMHYFSGTNIDLTGGPGSAVHELSFIPAGSLTSFNYINLNLNAEVEATINFPGTATVNFKVEHKESGGTYSDVSPGEVSLLSVRDQFQNEPFVGTYNSILHELTSAEQVSGLYLRMQSSLATGSNSDFTLKQFNSVLI